MAAGGTPAQGLYTAIVGGFFVSLLGGSRFQIGGPAGAFIVLLATTAQLHGMDGLILAMVLAGLKRVRPKWPGMLIAIGLAGAATALMHLPVATIGTAFGGIPRGLPLPALPERSFAKMQAVFPAAIAIALLGSIEYLFSATVADGMTGRRHRFNCELVAQGVANMASGLFGGICVTGTIARTAKNVRAGAHGPVSGILHSAFMLAFLLVVAWNTVEKHAFMVLLRASRADALALLVTFLFTVFRDLTEAIVVGVALGSVLFIRRTSRATSIETQPPFVDEDCADTASGSRKPYDEDAATSRDYVIYRISGAFFFGAAASIGSVLDRIADRHKALIIDFKAAPFIDSAVAHYIYELAHKTSGRNVALVVTGVLPGVKKELVAHEVCPPLATYEGDIPAAIESNERLLSSKTEITSP